MALTSCTNLAPMKYNPTSAEAAWEERAQAPEIRGSIASVAIKALHIPAPTECVPPRTGQRTWTIIRGTPVAFFWARLIHARFSQIRLAAREIRAAARRAWFVGENAYGKF